MSQSRFFDKPICDQGHAVSDWFRQPPGDRVAALEREVLSGMVADLFGYQLIQIGDLGGDVSHLARCPIKAKTLIGHSDAVPGLGMIVAEAQQLPVASDSIDAVLLMHTLDFAQDPHRVLREVERVLIADGRLIVAGFNPFSLWGLRRLAALRRRDVPWCGHFLSYPRLSDWLALLGFGVERVDVMEFRPPTRHAQLDWLERAGRRAWPMLAGVYVVRAVKRVARVTPLKPRWPRPRAVGSRAIEPTAREVRDV
jgi:SAM-dependent methyltransferase